MAGSALAICSLAVPPSAIAQGGAPSAATSGTLLEEVVVTASKHPLPLREVPFSVYVLGNEDIERTGARGFRDFLATVPGVSFADTGYADAKINIRGVSTDIYSEVRAATAVFLDDVPIADPGAHFIVQSPANPHLTDIARVEILRGPQGTLYGAGSMGGVVRIITRQPDPDRLFGEALGVASSTAHGGSNYETSVVINLPASPRSAVRLSGYIDANDGFIDNIGTGESNANRNQSAGGRAAVRFLGEDLDLQASIVHQSSAADGLNASNTRLDHYQQLTLVDQSYDDRWSSYALAGRYDLGWAQIVSSTSYLERWWHQVGDTSGYLDFLGSSGVVTAHHKQQLGELFQEVRLFSGAGSDFDWLAGFSYMDRNQLWKSSFPAPGFDAATDGVAAEAGAPDNLGLGHTRFDHSELAAFAEFSRRISARWKGVIGGRWTRTRERSSLDGTGLLNGGPTIATRRAEANAFVPNVTASYEPDAAAFLYATVSKGFRPGGPNFTPVPQALCAASLAAIGLSTAPSAYHADSLWNYEIGARKNWFDGRLRVSGAGYHIDWRDIQILAFLTCGTGFLHNAGKARSNGGELEISLQPLVHWQVGLNAAYVDAVLTRDVRALSVRSGDHLPGVPRLTLNGSVTYSFDRNGIHAFVRADAQWVGRSLGTFVPEGAVRLTAPAYTRVNLRVGMERNAWTVALFADNLLDRYGIVSSVDDFGLSPGGPWNNLIRPRTIGVELRWRAPQASEERR